jgi:hypothetical protein
MKEKPNVTTGDLVCIGFAAGRNPDGTFNASIPLYRPAESNTEDEFDGLTWDQLTALFDDMLKERAKVAEILEGKK